VEGETQRRVWEASEVLEAGIFGYFCTIHPSMVGFIVSGDTADAAVLADLRTSGVALKVDPPKVDVGTEPKSVPLGAVAGIAIAVGLVSAGGGFAIRRRS